MDKSKEQWDAEMAELIRECEIADKKWEEAKKTVFIDWNEGREAILKKGVSVTNIFGREEWILDIQDHCFVRNFPSLTIKNAHLTDCIFVNCGQITLEDGTAVRCVFSDIEAIFLDDMEVSDSIFRDLHCDKGGFVIGMEDSVVSGCKFFDIQLENNNYLAEGVGDCYVEKSSFKRISTDREDGELFTCEETTGKLIRRTKEYDMVDQDSCTGLDQIANQIEHSENEGAKLEGRDEK